MLADDYDSKSLNGGRLIMNRFCRPHRHLVENIYSATSEQTAQLCVDYIEQAIGKCELFFIEVPLEQYVEVVRAVERHEIACQSIIRQGAFTYNQVRHVAEAGNIHHLHINDEGRIYFTDEDISMSTAIAFAQSKWNGAERYEAVENSVYTGLMIIGEPFAQEVVGAETSLKNEASQSQLKKLITTTKQKTLTVKNSCLYVNNCIKTGAFISDMLTPEKIDCLVKEQLSPVQLFKTTAKTATSMLGGLIGILIGVSVGLFIPNVSTAVMTIIGGIMGLISGSRLASTISRKILTWFVPDETLRMLKIFKQQLNVSSEEFLLSKLELKQAMHDFSTLHDLRAQFQRMASSANAEELAKRLIESELTRIVRLRMYLQVPVNHEMYEVLETLNTTKKKGAVA